MKTRGIVIVLAVLLAGVATGAVYMYVQGVQQNVQTDQELVEILVARQDIPAGTQLDELIQQGGFAARAIPRDLVVDGAVVNLTDLQGRQTSSPILEGEQITLARLRGEQEVGGGILGIPPGMKAVSLPLDVSRAVGGVVQTGDHVTVYATVDGSSGSTTVTLVPDVQVLEVTNPGATPGEAQSGGTFLFTLALTPEDAQKVVFALERGQVWLGLLPPNEQGTEERPVTLEAIAR
jgi:pilus assembly protein CpaB